MCSSSSRVSRSREAGWFSLRTLAVLLVAALAPQTSMAVVVISSGLTATLTVQDGDPNSADITLDLASFITFDPATGRLALVAPGTDLGTSGWMWHRDPLDDPDTTQDETKLVMRWSTETLATISLLGMSGDIDPYMSYAFAVKNNTAFTQTYTFVFGEAIVPSITGGYYVHADVGVSLTNSPPAAPSAVIAPVSLAPKFQTLTLSDGITTFNAGVDVGNSYTRAAAGTGVFGEASPSVNGTTPLSLNYWEFQTRFTLTPGGDAVAISGFAEIIPEPSTYALLAGCGVLGVVALRRRKSRSSAVAG